MRFRAIAILGLSMVLSSSVFGVLYYKGKRSNGDLVKVVGMAIKRVNSDVIKWNITLGAATGIDSMKDGYPLIRRDLESTIKYLQFNGIKTGDIIIQPVSVQPSYSGNSLSGYLFEQKISAISTDIRAVEKLALDQPALLENDVAIQCSSLEYYYSKLPEIKMELLEEAAHDAARRARRIARCSGGNIGEMVFAKAGVFQVREPYSPEVSDSGMYNTYAREKDIAVTVNASFLLK